MVSGMEDIYLNKDYKFDGEWYFPGVDGPISGSIYLEEKNIELRLFGDDSKIQLLKSFQRMDGSIVGRCTDGRNILLIDPVPTSMNFVHGGMSSAKFFINRCLIGPFDPNNRTVRTVCISLHNLRHWICHRYINFPIDVDEGVTYEKPGSLVDFSVEWSGKDINISIDHRASETIPTGGGTKYSINIEPYIRVECESGLSFDESADISMLIEKFISLLSGDYNPIDKIWLHFSRDYEPDTFLILPWYKRSMYEDGNAYEIAYPREDVEGSLKDIFEKWIEYESKFKIPFNIFYRQIKNKEVYDGAKFLDYVQNLEILCRDKANNRILEKKEFKVVLETISGAVKEKHGDSIYSLYENKINSLNYKTFYDFLVEVVESDIPKLAGVFDACDREFLKKVVKTRNYLTHYSNSSGAFDWDDIPIATDKVQVLMWVLHLKQLGLDEVESYSRFRKFYLHQNAFDNQLMK